MHYSLASAHSLQLVILAFTGATVQSNRKQSILGRRDKLTKKEANSGLSSCVSFVSFCLLWFVCLRLISFQFILRIMRLLFHLRFRSHPQSIRLFFANMPNKHKFPQEWRGFFWSVFHCILCISALMPHTGVLQQNQKNKHGQKRVEMFRRT